MKQALIKIGGVVKNSARMEEAELLAWIESQKAMGGFGANEVRAMVPNILVPQQLDAQGNIVVAQVLEMEAYEVTPAVFDLVNQVQVSPAVMGQRPKLYDTLVSEAEYTIEISDVTAEVEAQEAIDVAFKEIEKGMYALATFKARIKAKELSVSQIGSLFSDASIQKIISALSMGSIEVSKVLIAAYVADGVLISNDDKDAVLAILNG
jgi:hypothetical protein